MNAILALTILLGGSYTWDTNRADYVIWHADDSETFVVNGKRHRGGWCEDFVRDGKEIIYYWTDSSREVYTTRVKYVFLEKNGFLIEVKD